MTRTKTMVARVEAYLHTRRKFGFQLRIEGRELLRFARYADSSGHRGVVTTTLALNWAQEAKAASPLYRARRLEIVRCFAKYQLGVEPETEVPPTGILGPAHRRTTPYIYSPSELVQLVKAASSIPSKRGLRAKTYATLLGLLACTGLRISEARRLKCADVDLELGTLRIRETKFKKSRIVPLHPSARLKLRQYVALRDRIVPPVVDATFFTSESGHALADRTVHQVLGDVIQSVVTPANLTRRPRIHDLRHTFACCRLLEWYRKGANIDQCVAALSTYLGHAKVSDTYWYLTGIPELMSLAAVRFERFGDPQGGRHGAHP
jgi:integrase